MRYRTLPRDLTFLLFSLVAMAMGLMGWWYFITSSRTMEQAFSDKSSFLLKEMAGVLSYPLYNLDKPTIVNITRAYDTGNPVITGIEVKSNFGEEIYNTLPRENGSILLKGCLLHHNSTEIGSLTIAFSRDPLTAEQTSAFKSAGIIIISILSIVAAGIHLFTKIALERPLNHLTRTIRRIAGGDFSGRLETVPQRDLAVIIEEVNLMAGQLASQQKQLQQSEQKYRDIFNNAIEGIFQMSLDGFLLTVNNALVHILGYDSAEELTQTSSRCSWCFFANPGDLEQILEAVRKKEKVSNRITALIRRDGQTVWCSINMQAVLADNTTFLHLEGSVEDISEIRHLENKLRQAQKMEAIGTLAGGIAHDFNNILTAIFGFTELAINSSNATEQQKYLQRIMEASQRARDLVRQILTFSRQTEKTKLPTPMHLILKETIKLLRSSIPATIAIEHDIRSEAYVLADPSQMHQVIMNLGTNGYHAMQENGGTLRFSLFDHALPASTVIQDTELPAGDYLILEVKDTGSGIKKELIDKIFEPYFTTKSLDRGTGLGLAVVHGIVGDCHGAIAVESRIGVGTVFRIFLPVVENNSVQERKEQSSQEDQAPAKTRGNEHILVVDDEDMIRRLISTYCTNCGYTITTAANGIAAVDLLKASPDRYNLLVTDLTMPGLTGLDLTRKARAISPGLPVILCTGFSTMLDQDEAEKAGVSLIVLKPVSMYSLVQHMRAVLDQQQALPVLDPRSNII